MEPKTYVLYHSKCYDGFGAAFAAWKKFGDSATYIAVSYGAPLPEMERGSYVYIVDFSYPAAVLLAMAGDHARVVVLDHHKTAEEALGAVVGAHTRLEIHFDMNRSGALMTWEYFHGTAYMVPDLIKHISDRDLWRFQLEGTKEIHMALVSKPMDFKLWDSFDILDLKVQGAAMIEMHENLVKNICEGAFEVTVSGHKVMVVNTTIAWSEVGDFLLKKYPESPFVMSFTVFKDNVMFSLRSRKDFDCSAISKKFGGGGHAQASGFKVADDAAKGLTGALASMECKIPL